MSKPTEDIVGIIPENEWQPELEKDVQYFASIAPPPLFVSKKRYTPDKFPEKFSSKNEELEFKLEVIRKLTEGYNGLSAKGWGWLNCAMLRDPEKGKIKPEFRAIQESFFQKIESLQRNPGRGIVGWKRRRVGASWMESWDLEHDSMTVPYHQAGMCSKSENDSRNLFKHVKFIHQNLPDWLRPKATSSDRRDYQEYSWFEKDAMGNRIKKGMQSYIFSVAPTDSAFEGSALRKLVIDEAGKISNLMNIWQYAEDCLRINTRRVGIPIVLGTCGSIDSDGRGLMELYMNNEAYQLDRFCFYGYNGLIVDEFGNDLTTHGIRWVVYERKRLEAATKRVRETFYQKYPLSDKDAFYSVSDGGVGNIQLINTQIIKIMSEPPERRVGFMRRNVNGEPDFVPDTLNGKVVVYDLPEKGRLNGYLGGSDNADHDDAKASKDVSELALAIVAKPFGTAPPKLVLEYCDRPAQLDKFFEQAAMCLQWYNNCKVLIEDNRARMINYFKEHYPHLLPLVPKSIGTAKQGFEMKHSVRMTEERKQQMMGLMEDYIDKYSQFVPSIKLLEQHKVFGDDHVMDDLAIAWGWSLVMLQADKKPASFHDGAIVQHQPLYQRINGVIQIMNSKGESMNRVNLPNSPLFNKR